MKQVLLIGGPNGAGKTTAAMSLMPHLLAIDEFVNADEIARGLNPLHPDEQAMAAGRLMIGRIAQLTHKGKSFAFETTCASHMHTQTLQQCKQAGYEVIVCFLWLPSAQMAISRVAQRVSRGGHAIPEAIIKRRYAKGLHNFVNLYMPLADRAFIYDNSEGALQLIVEKCTNGTLDILNQDIWNLIQHGT